ncbi:hypothetical protein DSCW_32760 [Desulfosarcina widdelii]|uniref:Uncharacterized protein n=1 Tax=Desulfosarcina widdelii TaxID=947919 RepID=A0A5K7Z6N0_9BACT|nr:hypothetical protein [Desulfosarcina widdelii]BBO75859.1 hypothetical protein DSCW_32760 [Desulfosarcina widdelii]
MENSDAYEQGRQKALRYIEEKIASFKQQYPQQVRTNIGIQVDAALWKQFKVRCLKDEITASAKIEELIAAYLAQPEQGR